MRFIQQTFGPRFKIWSLYYGFLIGQNVGFSRTGGSLQPRTG